MLKAELIEENKQLKAELASLREQLDALPQVSDDCRLNVLAEGSILYIALHGASSPKQIAFSPAHSWVGGAEFLNERLALYLNGVSYTRKLVGIESEEMWSVLDAEHLKDAEIEVMP